MLLIIILITHIKITQHVNNICETLIIFQRFKLADSLKPSIKITIITTCNGPVYHSELQTHKFTASERHITIITSRTALARGCDGVGTGLERAGGRGTAHRA